MNSDIHADKAGVINLPPPAAVTLFTRRWLMLAIFCVLSFSNAVLWITFSPVATLCQTFWATSSSAINALSLVYMAVFVPGCFLASWIVDSKSLRMGVALGAILNAVGAAWRVLPYPFTFLPGTHPYSFPAAMTGQTVCAAAQTFILAMPPKLAQNWFGERERVTATAIGALFNQAGVAYVACIPAVLCPTNLTDMKFCSVGFVMGPAVMQNDPNRLPLLMAIQAAISLLALLLCVLFFRSSPPTPPSVSAASTVGVNFTLLQSLRTVMVQPAFIILLVSFGIGTGSFYAVSTVIDYLSSALSYSTADSGLFGLLIVAVGMAGAIICGILAGICFDYNIYKCIDVRWHRSVSCIQMDLLHHISGVNVLFSLVHVECHA